MDGYTEVGAEGARALGSSFLDRSAYIRTAGVARNEAGRSECPILRGNRRDTKDVKTGLECEIMSGYMQSLSPSRRPTNQLLDAANLIAAGIAVASMGIIAVVGAIAWSDASILLLGLSTLVIGLAFVVQGWFRVRRFARALPDVATACASPVITLNAPLERWMKTLLAGAFVLAGVMFLSAGVFLMTEAEPSGIGILLLGGVFTAFGLRGLLIAARG